jgi:rhodanese-related sulfurtransferase
VPGRPAKNKLFDAFAEVAKALANGRRAEIIDVLAQGERSVDDLAGEIAQSAANTSQHLQVLARAGLVTTRRNGTRVYYQLASKQIEQLWSALRDVAAERVAGIDRIAADYLGDRSQLEAISREELLHRMQRGDVIVIDVRPEMEYRVGHVRGALSVPPNVLERELASLPGNVEVVAYCRGRYCVYADDAVRELRRLGRDARRLDDGFPEWRRAGFPIEPTADGADTPVAP